MILKDLTINFRQVFLFLVDLYIIEENLYIYKMPQRLCALRK